MAAYAIVLTASLLVDHRTRRNRSAQIARRQRRPHRMACDCRRAPPRRPGRDRRALASRGADDAPQRRRAAGRYRAEDRANRHQRQLRTGDRGRRAVPGAARAAGVPRRAQPRVGRGRAFAPGDAHLRTAAGPRHRPAGPLDHRAVAAAAVRRATDADRTGQPRLRSAAGRRAGNRPARRRHPRAARAADAGDGSRGLGQPRSRDRGIARVRDSSPDVHCATRERRCC